MTENKNRMAEVAALFGKQLGEEFGIVGTKELAMLLVAMLWHDLGRDE